MPNSNLKFNVCFSHGDKTKLFQVSASGIISGLLTAYYEAVENFGTTDLEPVSMRNVVTGKSIPLR